MNKRSAIRYIKRSYLGLRGFSLMAFQMPLWLGILMGTFYGKVMQIVVSAGAAAAFSGAAWLTRRYFLACRENYIQTGEAKSDQDSRPLALALVGAGCCLLASWAFKRPFPTGVILAGMGALGYYLRYMLPDPTPLQATPTRVETDHLNATLRQMINQAYIHIDELRDVQRHLRLRPQEHDIAMQLHGIILHSRRMIAIIAEQPERIRAARQFLVVQLPELAAISRAYLNDDGSEHETVRQNYAALLESSESALFQEKRLLDNSRFQTLDTRMQVLRDQLQIKATTHDQ